MSHVTGRRAPSAPPRIVACLAWYDEPVEFLTRCVASLAGLADVLVAVDGPWQGFPHAETWSPREQLYAIRDAADTAGLELDHWERNVAWDSQVAKRDFLMRRASQLGDWLLVIDGDEHIAEPHAAATRDQITATELDVGTVLCHVTVGATAADRYRAPIRRFYRAPVTVANAHNGYGTADGRWLHGDPTYVRLEPTFATRVLLHHEIRSRGDARNRAAADYRAHRRHHNLEEWRPHVRART